MGEYATAYSAIPRVLHTSIIPSELSTDRETYSCDRPLLAVLCRSSRRRVLIKSNANGWLARNETRKAHPTASRTLELLAVDMNADLERMLPVDTRFVARIISLVNQIDVDLNMPLGGGRINLGREPGLACTGLHDL